MADSDERFRRLLEQQLEMNPRTWAALESRGVNSETLLVIDFAFTAPGKNAAKQLEKILRQRTNFTSEIVSAGPRLKRTWRVLGHTRPSTASLEMLNDWVTFMVTLGAQNGECRFDGWGVEVSAVQLAASVPDDQLQRSFGEHRRNGHALNGSPAGDRE